jgi:hypothetical protein
VTAIQVKVVRGPYERTEILASVRQWCRNDGKPHRGFPGLEASVGSTSDLALALKSAVESSCNQVIVVSGMEVAEVEQTVRDVPDHGALAKKLRIIAYSARSQWRGMPLASLLSAPLVTYTAAVLPALRKAVLALHVHEIVQIREIRSARDFEAYLALRYQVWSQLGYLDRSRMPTATEWELNFTDQTARPIGAFDGDRLIGCARLVRQLGVSEPFYEQLIQQVIGARSDRDDLRPNLVPPRGMLHPFDVLESFPGFRTHYRELVRSRSSVAELSRVIVTPGGHYGRKGIGECLVDSITDLASNEHHVMVLACLEKHQRFYERCGYVRIEELSCDRFSGVNVPAIAMTREL